MSGDNWWCLQTVKRLTEDDVTAVMAKVIPGLLKVRLPRRR